MNSCYFTGGVSRGRNERSKNGKKGDKKGNCSSDLFSVSVTGKQWDQWEGLIWKDLKFTLAFKMLWIIFGTVLVLVFKGTVDKDGHFGTGVE